MKKIICLFLFALFILPSFAQDIISNSRCQGEDCIEEMQGNCGVLLLSKSKDLVVSSDNVTDGLSVEFKGMRPDGLYKYIVSIPAEATKNPNLQVSRRGSVFSTSFTAEVMKDYLVAYRIEEVAKPIRLDDTSQTNDVHFNATEAVLQITTILDNMQVICNPLLKATIKKTVSKADKQVKITTVVIPLSSVQAVKDKLAALNAEHERLFTEVSSLENPDEASAEVWNRIDALEQEIKDTEDLVTKIGDVLIKVKGSNDLVVNVSGYTARQIASYVVVPVVVEKEVFVTECSSFMSQAAKFYEMRKYKEARSAYENALNARDVVQRMRPSIRESILQCDSCILYEKLSTAALKKMVALKKDPNVTQDEVARYASAASDFLKVLYNYNPDPFYKKYIDKMDEVIATMPLVVKFTAVEWKTLEEGNYIPNVEVWAYYGDYNVVSSSLSSDRKFKKFLTNSSALCKQLGLTDERGIAEIELDRRYLPTAIIFRPIGRNDIKVKYLGLQELFSHAKGTYFEKQFRLKLFTKAD